MARPALLCVLVAALLVSAEGAQYSATVYGNTDPSSNNGAGGDVSVYLVAGQTFRILYVSGTYSWGWFTGSVDLQGAGGNNLCTDYRCPLYNSPYMQLAWRTSGSSWFAANNNVYYTAPTSGWLYLVGNDIPTHYGDNGGFIQLNVFVSTDCAVSFSAWSGCSVTCGTGAQTRTATITTNQYDAGAPCVLTPTTQSCGTETCTVTVASNLADGQCGVLVLTGTYHTATPTPAPVAPVPVPTATPVASAPVPVHVAVDCTGHPTSADCNHNTMFTCNNDGQTCTMDDFGAHCWMGTGCVPPPTTPPTPVPVAEPTAPAPVQEPAPPAPVTAPAPVEPTPVPVPAPTPVAPVTTYQWFRSSVVDVSGHQAIPEATSTTYQPVAGDIGSYLFFEVRPADGSPIRVHASYLAASYNCQNGNTAGSPFRGTPRKIAK